MQCLNNVTVMFIVNKLYVNMKLMNIIILFSWLKCNSHGSTFSWFYVSLYSNIETNYQENSRKFLSQENCQIMKIDHLIFDGLCPDTLLVLTSGWITCQFNDFFLTRYLVQVKIGQLKRHYKTIRSMWTGALHRGVWEMQHVTCVYFLYSYNVKI